MGEIVELEEGLDTESSFVNPGNKFYIEDEINRLFESIRIHDKTLRSSQVLKDNMQKKSMKMPMRIEPHQASGIRISKGISLKQALRGLSISQASEMAAMKRLSKSTRFVEAMGTGAVKNSQRANGNKHHMDMVEVSLVPERLTLKLAEKMPNSAISFNADGKSRSKENMGFSWSSKDSLCEYSSSTSLSDESNISGFRQSGHRPHMSKDLKWEAIYRVQKQNGNLSVRNFKLIKKLGGGDIGNVYLAELIGSKCFFALKVVDNECLGIGKKATRAQTECEILQLLDHPFLPTLFAQFTTYKHSCLVIEYCPGGDLHVLRQKHPGMCFSEPAARFYVAEILLALEYLHMLGIVYRDLKPENILVREDGHIMLTDFDLSLRCSTNPTLLNPSSPPMGRPKNPDPTCIAPFCLQPPWQVPCFASRTRKQKPDPLVHAHILPQLLVEPTGARSNSFVGTHEYLAPEIINGEGHGSPVDWWTFGVLLYELLYGKTPFKGIGDEDTLVNVVSRDVKFPDTSIGSSDARDLIRKLLMKQPENRLGSVKGAVEIKQHPFFEGMNWALIRCMVPPDLPRVHTIRSMSLKNIENMKFDMF